MTHAAEQGSHGAGDQDPSTPFGGSSSTSPISGARPAYDCTRIRGSQPEERPDTCTRIHSAGARARARAHITRARVIWLAHTPGSCVYPPEASGIPAQLAQLPGAVLGPLFCAAPGSVHTAPDGSHKGFAHIPLPEAAQYGVSREG